MVRHQWCVIGVLAAGFLLCGCASRAAEENEVPQTASVPSQDQLESEPPIGYAAEVVDPFMIASGEWVYLASMQLSRSEYSAVAIDGLIYAPGGLGDGSTTNSSNALERYDPATNTWEYLAVLPKARDHTMTAVWNGKLYFFGGSDISGRGPNAWVYDPGIDRWQSLSNMPFRLSAGAAITVGDDIYIFGGLGDPFADVRFNGEVLRYDPHADEWTMLSSMPVVVNHCAVVMLDGEIYVIGGRSAAQDHSLVQIYNPEHDQWREGISLQQARAGHAAVVVDGLIYVMGGERINSEDYSVLASVEIFDPAAQSWTFGVPMPVALHGVPAVVINGTIFVIGGSELVGDVANHGYLLAFRP